MENKRRIILVIGMGRSGTSALTKGLTTMGVSIMPASSTVCNSFNEKGYWEDQEIQMVNSELARCLSVRKKHSRSFIPMTEEENDFLCNQSFFAEAIALLSQKTSTSQSLGIKDPNITLFLPFWKRVFQVAKITPSFVIALRDPVSVVASMNQFTEKSSEESCWNLFWVWISFLLSCVEHTESHPSIIVDYQELLQDPASQMKRVAHALNLEIDHDLVKNYSDDFVDPGLCHFKLNSEIQDNKVSLQKEQDDYLNPNFLRNFSIEIYHQLLAAAQDRIPFSQLNEALEPWKKEFLLAKPLLCLAEKNAWAILELKNKIINMGVSTNKKTIENLMMKAQSLNSIHQHHLQYIK